MIMLKTTLFNRINPLINKFHFIRNLNNHVGSICKTNRKLYLRTYPTRLVLEDGSSINIRYQEPRQIIKLPLDLTTLTEAQRKIRLDSRKPKTKITIVEFEDDEYDPLKYINLINK